MNNSYQFDCYKCQTKCSGVSKGVYIFENDTAYSEKFENKIVELINEKTSKIAKRTNKPGYLDIEINNKSSGVICYIEIKAQQRTFMSVERLLPNADLKPSETIALNLSDLKRYFDIYERIKIPIYLVWVVSNRPCILKNKKYEFFFQDLNELQKIFRKYEMARRFRRKSGYGDVVNGQHKGVVVNYHFSLNELERDIVQLIYMLNDKL